MDYLLKASALLTIFYGCYTLFLQRETFFRSNRWFLVLGLLTSVLLPLFVIPIYVQMPSSSNDSFKLVASTIQNTPETIDLTSVLMWTYIMITSFFLGRMIIQLFSLIVLIKKHDKKKTGPYSFIETQQNTAPFSFFRWIVYNPEQFNRQELQLILNHEKVHAKQMHSLDVLLTDIISALFWFNPFIWLYRKALKQNLEFIADYNTQKATDCEERYQKLLLKTSLPQENLIFINTFYNSTIKKRIVMLHKSKSNLMNTWKYTIIVPILVAFAMTFNTKTIAQTSDQVIKPASSVQQNLLKNDSLPPLILLDGKEISKKQMDAIDPETIKGVFVLKEDSARKKYGEKGKDGVILITTKKDTPLNVDENPPLYILDGKEITKEQMSAIDPNTINAVNVLKDEKATKEYGKKGKNGVIIITLKKE